MPRGCGFGDVTFGRYLVGIAFLFAALAPVAAAAWMLRSRILPRWGGAPARLAEVVIALAIVLGVAQVLGVLGAFRPIPTLLGCVVAGIATFLLARRWQGLGDVPGPPPAPTPNRVSVIAAVVACALVAADWGPRVTAAIKGGMKTVDTLWYHLPQAARFMQEGSITGLHYVDSEPVTVFYPANSALLHALGMQAFGNDLLSVFVNVGWLGLALLSGWCIGRPRGLGASTLLGMAVVLALPSLVTTQPGGAYNDVMGLALFMAAVALLVNGSAHPGATAVAAIAAGIALGTKYTMIAPVLALAVGTTTTAARGTRGRVAVTWMLALAAAGGLWYARNLLRVGNPLPSLHLAIGPISLPSPPVPTPTFTVAEFLPDTDLWDTHFIPGFDAAFGPAWVAVLALGLGGAALGASLRGERVARMLGLVAIATAVAFLVTPQFLGLEGNPLFFSVNLRYVTPALALGMAVLPWVPALQGGWRRWSVVAAFAGTLAATQFDPTMWPTENGPATAQPVAGTAAWAGATLGGFVLVGAAAAAWLRRVRPARHALVGGMVGVAAATIGLGWAAQHVYFKDRYANLAQLPTIARWARGVHDSRIATVGVFLQYPLYGSDLSNRVQYIGKHGPHGAFSPIETCPEWREALNAGRYRYVLVAPDGFPDIGPKPAPEAAWTESDPAAHLVLRDRRPGAAEARLFRIKGRLDTSGCEGLPRRRDVVLGSGG